MALQEQKAQKRTASRPAAAFSGTRSSFDGRRQQESTSGAALVV